MSEKGKNIAASVRHRLAKVAERAGVDFQQVLSSYAIERFLYRLSVSEHANDFVLKGATLFTLWEGFPHRQTRDVDLLGFGDKDIERLVEVFQEILASPVPEDGLTYSKEVSGEAIRAVQEYGGKILQPADPFAGNQARAGAMISGVPITSIGSLRAIPAAAGLDPKRAMSIYLAAKRVSTSAPELNGIHFTRVPKAWSKAPSILPRIQTRGPPA